MITSLLINYKDISKKNDILSKFINKLSIPTTTYSIGIILILKKTQLDKLNKLKSGIDKILFLNIIDFNNIFYIVYNESQKICELLNTTDDINTITIIISSLLDNFPKDTMLWTKVSDNNYHIYKSIGFNEPFMCKKSPLNTGDLYNEYSICMYRRNISLEHIPCDRIENNIELETIKDIFNRNLPCVINLRFKQETLDYLKSLCTAGELTRNGRMIHKEIAGSLFLINTDNVYDIDIKKDSIIIGSKEGVSITDSRYNFHSHPEQAYIRHDVIDGHPSVQDYIGYVQAIRLYGTVFHCVTTLEGIYIISLQEYWSKNIDKIPLKFIEKNFDIPHVTNKKTHKHHVKKQHLFFECNKCLKKHNIYIEIVNTLSYSENPIFKVDFFKWVDYDYLTIFTVISPKIGQNCIISDESYKLHKKFYS